jgi:hypothetical protein
MRSALKPAKDPSAFSNSMGGKEKSKDRVSPSLFSSSQARSSGLRCSDGAAMHGTHIVSSRSRARMKRMNLSRIQIPAARFGHGCN